MTSDNELRELERIVVDAWPANEVAEHAGWLLRASGGPTHRGNSVAPLAAHAPASGPTSLEARIDVAEAWYRERGRRAMFQIGPCAAPDGLDAALAARGYVREGDALLARGSLADVASVALGASGAMSLSARVEARPSAAWLELNARSSRFASSMDVFRAFLARLGGRCRFVAVQTREAPEETVATGLGITSGAYLGVYAMFTRPDFRRRGAARAALKALAESAIEDGATSDLYLLVERDNAAARRLYAQCGFRDVYDYHYRVTER